MEQQTVVLFKGKEANDRYGETLVKAGFAVEYIPVLRFDVHPEKVAKLLPKYSGDFVLTSPRAAKALVEAFKGLALSQGQAVYVVGKKTEEVVSGGVPGLRVEGAESGSAGQLADHIIAHHAKDRPLLYLSGSTRRDELVERLSAAGMALEEVVVYESNPRPAGEVASQLVSLNKGAGPLGVETVVKCLASGALDALKGADGTLDITIGAIGKTTLAAVMKALSEAQQILVAKAPSPEGVLQALLEGKQG